MIFYLLTLTLQAVDVAINMTLSVPYEFKVIRIILLPWPIQNIFSVDVIRRPLCAYLAANTAGEIPSCIVLQVTICAQYCNDLWNNCGNALLGNVAFRSLYRNGQDFCEKQNFVVQQTSTRNCFNFDYDLIANDAKLLEVSTKLLFVLSSLVILFVL